MSFDSLNLPLIISKNFNAKRKDIQGSEIVISPTTKAKLPDPIQPSILYMEASLPSQLQSMSISKTTSTSTCPLSSRLRQLLPPPSATTSSLLCSPLLFNTTDDEEESQQEEDTTTIIKNHIPMLLNPAPSEFTELEFTQHLETSSASSVTSSTSSSNGSKQYICSLCQKKFMRPSSLKIHIYSHTGEKPFNCSFPGCRRRFSVQSNMRRHLRVHSN